MACDKSERNRIERIIRNESHVCTSLELNSTYGVEAVQKFVELRRKRRANLVLLSVLDSSLTDESQLSGELGRL